MLPRRQPILRDQLYSLTNDNKLCIMRPYQRARLFTSFRDDILSLLYIEHGSQLGYLWLWNLMPYQQRTNSVMEIKDEGLTTEAESGKVLMNRQMVRGRGAQIVDNEIYSRTG